MTEEIIIKTREHFVAVERACIEEAVSGNVRVNDLESYVKWCERNISEHYSGENDHTFTFRQYAHYLETGEYVPFLS